MNVLVFDTETTGLVKWKRPVSDKDQPYLMQLGLILVSSGAISARLNFVVHSPIPPGPKAFDAHGISHDLSLASGMSGRWTASVWRGFVRKADIIAAHNLDFDEMVMRAHFYRYRVEWPTVAWTNARKICTMKEFQNRVDVKTHAGHTKFPRLAELHARLFGAQHEDQHDALGDVEATYKCLKKAAELGWTDSIS